MSAKPASRTAAETVPLGVIFDVLPLAVPDHSPIDISGSTSPPPASDP
jgi:hypothetical protein